MTNECLQTQLAAAKKRLEVVGVADELHSSYALNLLDRLECGDLCRWDAVMGGLCIEQAMQDCSVVSTSGCTPTTAQCHKDEIAFSGCPLIKE
jgi:hypothetical protein